VADLSKSGIGDIETGDNTPTLLSLLKMSEVLDVHLDEILADALKEDS